MGASIKHKSQSCRDESHANLNDCERHSYASFFCEGSHDDVQIQGAVQSVEEMEFCFVDSRNSWKCEFPDNIGDESPSGRKPGDSQTAISAATIMLDEHVANLPPHLFG